jgi:anaerobic selenocysteine-containing dehydrogenase
MRQGHPGQRAKLVQFEPRISLTGANADEWVAVQPGAEGALALSLSHVILRDKLRPADAATRQGRLIEGWSDGLRSYSPEAIEAHHGIPAPVITRLAHEAAANGPAVAVIGDAATSQTNGLFNALAVNALNALLGNIGNPGGIQFSPQWNPQNAKASSRSVSGQALLPVQTLASRIVSGAFTPRALFAYNANPVFAAPPAWKIQEAISRVPFFVSLGSFIDETSILADLILPDHSPLESWLDHVPASGVTGAVVSLAPPTMQPLHSTRAMPDVLLSIAHRLGGDLDQALPWATYEESLKASFTAFYKETGETGEPDADAFWKKVQEQGGWWSSRTNSKAVLAVKGDGLTPPSARAEFDGLLERYPFHLLPFASQMHYDGSLANLPWIQEAPDPLSTVMWGTWVEVNPKTAAAFNLQQGDLVQVDSQHGSLKAPAFITPGIAPNVIAMPVGQGHQHFTRYAKDRGANPIAILAPMQVSGTDSLAWAATRVKISRVGKGNMIVFGGSLTETPPETEHR